MVPITFIHLSDVTASIMPVPLSALCVFKILRLEKCKGGSNNEHTAPETRWGPAGLSPTHKYICPNNALITDLTFAVSPWTSNITRPTIPPPPRPILYHLGLQGAFFMLPAVHELETSGVHVLRKC